MWWFSTSLPKGYVGVPRHLKGVFACTACDNVEPGFEREVREVKCSQCGKGVMVWLDRGKVATLVHAWRS